MLLCPLLTGANPPGLLSARQCDTVTGNCCHRPDAVGHITTLPVTLREAHPVSLLADNMQDGVRIARDNPDSGVVVRIAGEGRPWNPGAITGGRVWGDIPDNSVQLGAGNGEPVTAEVLAQRQAEEAIRRETERRADEIVRKMAENKPDLPDGKTEQAVREIAGQERERAAITEREAALPESVLRESQRERDMVRDLQKEKTPGGD